MQRLSLPKFVCLLIRGFFKTENLDEADLLELLQTLENGEVGYSTFCSVQNNNNYVSFKSTIRSKFEEKVLYNAKTVF